MAAFAYARVSTDGQSLESQQLQLKAAGAEKVFAEKQSGAKTDRRQLQRALDALGKGDTLIVTRLDRLARSTLDLLHTLDTIAKKGASFRSLNDPWCDTTTPHGKLMLTVLGGLAEFERSLILARTSEGRKRAKANGVKFGAPFKMSLYQRREALERLSLGQTQAEIAKTYGVDATTVGRLAKREWAREAKRLAS